MAVAELQALIRTDPDQRAAAWAEITYRNQARQAFDTENGYQPERKTVLDRRVQSLKETLEANFDVKPWVPPDLTPPPPLGKGPLED
jgi:hypothetical protein